MRCFQLFLLGLTLAPLGCASTTVHKNPGPDDTGVRYYLPKPYLKLEQTRIKDTETTCKLVPGMVTITLEMLPDFSEEYSVHVRAGAGINNTKLTLDHGWQLTEVNCKVFSNASENLDAITQAISMLPGRKGDSHERATNTVECGAAVHASNVPLGYYEAVLTPDDCGKRRFNGWRYVGFAPFAQCPLHMHGVESRDCHDGDLYGLVYEQKSLVFRKLCDVSRGPGLAQTSEP